MLPTSSHDSVQAAFNAFRPAIPQKIRYHFGPAWNGVGQRYRMATEYHADFGSLLTTTGSGAHRYEEDKALFGFFAAANSVVDCFAYALHAIGAAVAPSQFSIDPDDLRDVTVSSVARGFGQVSSGSDLALHLAALRDATQLALLRRLRNIVIHRVVPGRQIWLSTHSTISDDWHLSPHGIADLTLAPSDVERFLTWLPPMLDGTATAAARFLTDHSEPLRPLG